MPLIYSILFNNRSFSVIISRYRTTCKSCLRMVTDPPDCLGQRDTSCFPLKKVLAEASRWSAPCWPERHPSHVCTWRSPAQERGRGNNSGSCEIKVDLDSLRKFSVLLPEGNWPISEVSGRTWWTRSWMTVVQWPSWLCQQTHSTTRLSVLPTLLHPSLPTKGISCANKPDVVL